MPSGFHVACPLPKRIPSHSPTSSSQRVRADAAQRGRRDRVGPRDHRGRRRHAATARRPGTRRDPMQRDGFIPVDDTGTVEGDRLWWPPAKVSGRHLSPYLVARNVVHLPLRGADAGVESIMRVPARRRHASQQSRRGHRRRPCGPGRSARAHPRCDGDVAAGVVLVSADARRRQIVIARRLIAIGSGPDRGRRWFRHRRSSSGRHPTASGRYRTPCAEHLRRSDRGRRAAARPGRVPRPESRAAAVGPALRSRSSRDDPLTLGRPQRPPECLDDESR